MTRQEAVQKAYKLALKFGLSEASAMNQTHIATPGIWRESGEYCMVFIGDGIDEWTTIVARPTFEEALAAAEMRLASVTEARAAKIKADLERLG